MVTFSFGKLAKTVENALALQCSSLENNAE